jgi:hypothetical protein
VATHPFAGGHEEEKEVSAQSVGQLLELLPKDAGTGAVLGEDLDCAFRPAALCRREPSAEGYGAPVGVSQNASGVAKGAKLALERERLGAPVATRFVDAVGVLCDPIDSSAERLAANIADTMARQASGV